MFDPNRSSVRKRDVFRTKVKNQLGENRAVSTQNYDTYILCKDFNDLISKGGIHTAMKEQFNLKEFAEQSPVSVGKAYGVKRLKYDHQWRQRRGF